MLKKLSARILQTLRANKDVSVLAQYLTRNEDQYYAKNQIIDPVADAISSIQKLINLKPESFENLTAEGIAYLELDIGHAVSRAIKLLDIFSKILNPTAKGIIRNNRSFLNSALKRLTQDFVSTRNTLSDLPEARQKYLDDLNQLFSIFEQINNTLGTSDSVKITSNKERHRDKIIEYITPFLTAINIGDRLQTLQTTATYLKEKLGTAEDKPLISYKLTQNREEYYIQKGITDPIEDAINSIQMVLDMDSSTLKNLTDKGKVYAQTDFSHCLSIMFRLTCIFLQESDPVTAQMAQSNEFTAEELTKTLALHKKLIRDLEKNRKTIFDVFEQINSALATLTTPNVDVKSTPAQSPDLEGSSSSLQNAHNKTEANQPDLDSLISKEELRTRKNIFYKEITTAFMSPTTDVTGLSKLEIAILQLSSHYINELEIKTQVNVAPVSAEIEYNNLVNNTKYIKESLNSIAYHTGLYDFNPENPDSLKTVLIKQYIKDVEENRYMLSTNIIQTKNDNNSTISEAGKLIAEKLKKYNNNNNPRKKLIPEITYAIFCVLMHRLESL
jgi:ABC-type transporter Mla subunit MlaD